MQSNFRAIVGAAAIGASVLTFVTVGRAADMVIPDACAAIGLTRGELPFVLCVQSLRTAVSMPEAEMAALKIGPVDAIAGRETRIGHRSDYACRAVGLNPETIRFAYCVADLRATLFDASTVGQD